MPKPSAEPSARPRCMDPGVLGASVEEFARDLTALGHTRLTVQGYTDAARHFAEWLDRIKGAPAIVEAGDVERFARHRCHCTGNRRRTHLSGRYARRVRRFVRFLTEDSVVVTTTTNSDKALNEQVAAFQNWLKSHRGISEPTIDRYGRMIMRLLPVLGEDLGAYDAGLVRGVILEEARTSSRPYVKTMTTALRGYLRFLASRGLCRPWLDQAIPSMPQWRLSALPRYLPGPDVERLIASCDLTKPHGIRDRAILLLLARLGLRAGDILDMRLDDVAWEEGTLRVRGKGRREARLPLPQDAGDAVLDYLERSRPAVAEQHLFLRSCAPHRPFADSSSVSSLVRLALQRAGIAAAPSRGANLLRHSAATAMLRAGATLDTVGTVLRHRSPDTTAHYAKVDVAVLQRIAQPWPGGVPC